MPAPSSLQPTTQVLGIGHVGPKHPFSAWASSSLWVSLAGWGQGGRMAKTIHPGKELCPPWAWRNHPCIFVIQHIWSAPACQALGWAGGTQ